MDMQLATENKQEVEATLFALESGRWVLDRQGQQYMKILPEGSQLREPFKSDVLSHMQAMAHGYNAEARIETRMLPSNKESNMSSAPRTVLLFQHPQTEVSDGSVIENRGRENEFKPFVDYFVGEVLAWRKTQRTAALAGVSQGML